MKLQNGNSNLKWTLAKWHLIIQIGHQITVYGNKIKLKIKQSIPKIRNGNEKRNKMEIDQMGMKCEIIEILLNK